MSEFDVTVIVPMYNCETTIKDCVNAILTQSVTAKVLLLIDDCSTDKTLEIAEGLKESPLCNTKIKIFSFIDNGGPAIARNFGWNKAETEYVAFCDADDIWSFRKLQAQKEVFMKNSEFQLCGVGVTSDVKLLNDSLLYSIKKFTFWDFIIRNRLATSGVVLKRNIVERFPTKMRYSEDYALWLKLVKKHRHVGYIDAKYVFYNKDVCGLSDNRNLMKIGEISALHDVVQGHICKHLLSLYVTLKYGIRKRFGTSE